MISVSVIVITYNSQDYIKETLDSILLQELTSSIELNVVVGDDCSKDNTRNILLDYYEKFPNRISLVFNEQNMGVINNYFNVFNHCSGDYIMECAGDDYWLPGKVKTQIGYLEEHSEYLACCGDAQFLINDTTCIKRNAINKGTDFDTLIRGNTIVTPTICFRKSAMKTYISEVDPINRDWIMEDYPAWLWMSKNGKIAYIDKEMAVYRINNNSISHQLVLSKQLAFEENTYHIQQFFSENDMIRAIALDGHLLRLEEIYLDFGKRKEYRKIVRKRKGMKALVKYYCSFLPGFLYIVKLIRKIKYSYNQRR